MKRCEICKREVDIYGVDKHHQDCIAKVSMPKSYEDIKKENKELRERIKKTKHAVKYALNALEELRFIEVGASKYYIDIDDVVDVLKRSIGEEV